MEVGVSTSARLPQPECQLDENFALEMLKLLGVGGTADCRKGIMKRLG